jgi:3-hydroxyisobutyrate dehydrogenase
MLPKCFAGGFADSTLLRKLYPRIQRREFEPPQAYSRQLLKDMKSVGKFASSVGRELPLVLKACDRFAEYVDSGAAMSDPASLIRLYDSDG